MWTPGRPPLTRSLSGGQTKLISADGNWKVEHGVARTDDTKALLEASTASLAGTVNLRNAKPVESVAP